MTDRPSVDALRTQTKGALKAAGISQAEAGRQLGLSTKHMSHMLTGRATLTLDWADRILALCDTRLVIATSSGQTATPGPRVALDDLTSDQLDALYDDLERYEEVQGEMNERAVDLTRRVAELEAQAAEHLAAHEQETANTAR
ncbi:helix-turn-helix domain-containing protein [Streptomyces sp. NPDC005576]|uniref:helix-turn-helix domain-containing protein n=1 Tax=Streptomyces sp. NPDC005576 TaxID=3364726 RepID=UPI00367AD253